MEKAKLLNMTRQRGWRITGVALLYMGMLALSGCARDTPEDALRVQLQQMEQAATAREPRAFMDGVAEDFSGEGGIDRAALHNLLRMQLLGNAKVGVTTGPLQVEMQGDRARVSFSAVLTGGSGRFLPDAAQSYAITTGWRVEDGDWRLYYAQWEPNL